MTDQILDVAVRENGGKGAARAARRAGKVPGVIYGGKKDPVMINVDQPVLLKHLKAGKFLSTLLTVQHDGGKDLVLCRDVQRDKLNGLPIHVDFMRVSARQKVEVFVPVVFLNQDECKGLKMGGTLVEVRPEVELRVPANAIPDHIEVDLTEFTIGDVIHISDFTLPEGAEPVIDDRDFVVANISAPMGEEVEEEAEEGAEAVAEAEGTEAEAEGGDDD